MGSQSVQAIASTTTTTIPMEFVRAETEQPGKTTSNGPGPEIPVIDLSGPNEEVVGQIFDASSKWGIFQVVNHGIPNEVINKLQKVGKEFFELPQEEKELIAKPIGAKNIEGYGTNLQKEVEGKKAWVDHLFHKIWPPSAIDFNFWPKNPPSYREVNEEYASYLHGVVDKLLIALSLGLGLKGDDLKKAVGDDELVYMLKINYYPKCPQPDLALGVVAHTDMSAITILVPNDVQGLQVFEGQYWFNVKYIPNALIIHIGDQIEILSNGKYKSVLHRSTVNKDKTRMSWPVFLEPPTEFTVGPHPKLINQINPPKFKTKTYGDYLYRKLNKLPQ